MSSSDELARIADDAEKAAQTRAGELKVFPNALFLVREKGPGIGVRKGCVEIRQEYMSKFGNHKDHKAHARTIDGIRIEIEQKLENGGWDVYLLEIFRDSDDLKVFRWNGKVNVLKEGPWVGRLTDNANNLKKQEDDAAEAHRKRLAQEKLNEFGKVDF